MITLKTLILSIIVTFIIGMVIGVFLTALMSANSTTIHIKDPSDMKPKFFCRYSDTGICIGCPNQLDCYDNLNK